MRDADILAACKAKWLTAREIGRPGGVKNVGHLLPRLYVLYGRGFLRMRPRKHEPGEDGNKPPGPPPSEFRVHTDWGGLA